MSESGGDSRIRLLMVNTVPADFNGQMMFILKYLRAMDRTGMAIGFASMGEPIPEIRARLDALGVAVFVLPRRSRHPLGYMGRLRRIVRDGRYDIVHVHGNSATVAIDLLAARLGGARVRIAHSHNTSTGYPVVHRLLRPLMLALANVRMACGEAAGQWLFGGRPFEVVPIAADPEVYGFDAAERRARRAALGLGPEDVLAGMVGQLIPTKNPAFMLEVLAAVRLRRPGVKLMLMGEGPQREALEGAAERLGLRDAVIFTGAVKDVPGRLQGLDLLAMPSLYEGFPNVLVEAQLAGLPALVSDRVTRDCDMTGLLTYLPLEGEAWAEALKGFAKNDRAAASAAAREALARRGYEIHAAAAKLRGRYEALLSGMQKEESR